jgi:type I restriction enzyme, S subunit
MMSSKHLQKLESKRGPKLRFPSFKGDWEDKILGEIFKRNQNRNLNNKENQVLTNSALEGIVNQQDYFDKDIANQNNLTNYFVVDINDFIYNPRISKSASVGPFKRNKLQKGIMSPLYTVLKPKIGDLTFLEKYFETKHWHRYMYKIANYGARYDRMSILLGDFLKMPVPFPPLSEQQKIAEFLGLIDGWIENLSVQKKLLQEYKKGMLQKIFTQEIRFKDENGNDFPDWEDKKLKNVLIEHKTKNSDNSFNEVFSVAKEKGIINQIEHLGRSYASDDLTNYKVVYPDDVIYTKSPVASFPYGIIKQNQLNRIGVVSTLYAVFKPQNKYIGTLLHYYFLSWVNTYNYLNPLVQKGAKNTINISNKDFLNGAKISLPTSEKEQKKLVEFLDSIYKAIELKEQQVSKAEEWKKGLMQNLFV